MHSNGIPLDSRVVSVQGRRSLSRGGLPDKRPPIPGQRPFPPLPRGQIDTRKTLPYLKLRLRAVKIQAQ